MRAAFAAGKERCSNCEQKRMTQRRNGATKLCECLETSATIEEYFQARGEPVPFPPGVYGLPQMGYQEPPTGYQMPPIGYEMPSFGFGMTSIGYWMPPMGWRMPPMGWGMPPTGYGMPSMGYGMPQMPPAGAQSTPPPNKRKEEDDDSDEEIREVKKQIERQRQLKSLRSDLERIAGSPDEDAYRGEREANRGRRESETQNRVWDRSASVQRGRRPQSTYRPPSPYRPPPTYGPPSTPGRPNPNSMVDKAARIARLDREKNRLGRSLRQEREWGAGERQSFQSK